MDGYEALANAIVAQAAKDYRDAVRMLKRHPDSTTAMKAVMDLGDFFHSDWYETLTAVDADYLIDRLRKEAVK